MIKFKLCLNVEIVLFLKSSIADVICSRISFSVNRLNNDEFTQERMIFFSKFRKSKIGKHRN